MPLLQSLINTSDPKIDTQNSPSAGWESPYGKKSQSGETVSIFSSQCIATAYRAKNIISDAVGILPFKMYQKSANGSILNVEPDHVTRNMPYLMQISPNTWGWTPFLLKKAVTEWLIFHGNSYQWRPPKSPNQVFVLPANRTRPVFDLQGNLWYEHRFSNSPKPSYIPGVEILHLLINPDETGWMGRGVVTFARETFGRRMAANKTQSKMYAQGFMPAAVMTVDGEASKEVREKIRDTYEGAMSGSDNAFRLAILDNKIKEYKPVELQTKDSSWLESISATDDDIALFFGMPGHMLNKGKEAYNSNEQKYQEFVSLTLDPFLVPWEEAARVRWLSRAEQVNSYFKFKREALLRMAAKERAEMNNTKIQSGQMTPNEARAQDELNPYDEGDQYWMASNIQPISKSVSQAVEE
jgi:HK97 family phage portal protein